MDLVHVVPTYYPATRYGGPIRSVHGLCQALAARGHRVRVFTTNVDGDQNSAVPLGQPLERDGVMIHYFASRFLRRLYLAPRMIGALRDALRSAHVAHLHSVFLWPTWIAARIAQQTGVPYLLAPRGMLDRNLIEQRGRLRKSAWIRLFERSNLGNAAMVHFTSRLEQHRFRELSLPENDACVIPNGVAVPAFAPTERTPDAASDEPTVLFLGRIDPKKGLLRLIEAWRHVPRGRLVVAGNDEQGHWAQIERAAAGAGVRSRVDYIGPQDDQHKWSLLRAADLFVLPSYSENFGIAALEALAVGCPVVLTPEVGLAAAVERAAVGVVVDGDPPQLGAAINGLLRDPARRARMSEAARTLVEREYSWDAIAERMEAAYERCRGSRR